MSVITVRVAKEIKQKLERHKVNISETVRDLLEKYVAELETRNLAQELEHLRERVSSKIDPQIVAQLVREDREKR
jgi:predicted DNA-binding protein